MLPEDLGLQATLTFIVIIKFIQQIVILYMYGSQDYANKVLPTIVQNCMSCGNKRDNI